MAAGDLKLLQGTLDVLVPKALLPGPRHSYGVAQWIRETTDDALNIEDGARYTALHRMEKWKNGSGCRRIGASRKTIRKAKYYRLTSAGRKQLQTGTRDWTQYAEAVFKVLEAPEVVA